MKLINNLYKNKKEFFIHLKSGDLYKVSEVIKIDGYNIKVNILRGNLLQKTFTSNKFEFVG